MVRATCFAILLALMYVLAASGQQPPQGSSQEAQPDFSLLVWGYFDVETLTDFTRRVQGYVSLRERLQVGLPPLQVTSDANEIIRVESLLARRIRRARPSSRRRGIFSGSMERQVRKFLRDRVDASTLAAISEDSPGEFDLDVNGMYPRDKPLATMPPNLLLLLPDLGADMEYRFVGRHLVVRDVRANIIVDYIPRAIGVMLGTRPSTQ
jgi:hypothetical protein